MMKPWMYYTLITVASLMFVGSLVVYGGGAYFMTQMGHQTRHEHVGSK